MGYPEAISNAAASIATAIMWKDALHALAVSAGLSIGAALVFGIVCAIAIADAKETERKKPD